MHEHDWRNFHADALPPLLRSALTSFTRSGYHGTTTRTLAADAGLSVPGLYHHYPSKQALLVAITDASMADLMARSLAALAEAGGDTGSGTDYDPLVALELHIECMVLFHAYYRELAFLAASEIRSLEPGHRERYLAARDAQEQLLRGILQRGVDSGVFDVPDVKGTTRALVTMCTGVSQWFDRGGPQRAEDVAAEYVAIARRVVGCAEARS